MLSLTDIEDILRIKLIGVIPESEAVLQASNQGLPAIHLKDTDVSEAYRTSSPATWAKTRPCASPTTKSPVS